MWCIFVVWGLRTRLMGLKEKCFVMVYFWGVCFFVCFFSETVLLNALYITERNSKVRAFVHASCRMYMPTCKWEFQTVEYLLWIQRVNWSKKGLRETNLRKIIFIISVRKGTREWDYKISSSCGHDDSLWSPITYKANFYLPETLQLWLLNWNSSKREVNWQNKIENCSWSSST